MEPREHRAEANGIELAWFEWGASHRGDGPSVLLVHATGFHARCWDPVVPRLGARHVVAIDQRGHGRSEKVEIEHWDVFGRDLADFVRGVGLERVVGVGHSMGGHAMVDAAAAEPGRFERLVLIDPVIAAAGEYGGGGWKMWPKGGEPHPTARRKRLFDSPEAMIERFRDRRPYSVFTEEALDAYCRYGLLPVEGGGEEGARFELACPPEIEASVYMTSRSNAGVHESARALELPVLIVRAMLPTPDRGPMDFSVSPTWPGLVGEFRHGHDLHLAEHTHFLPMEVPGRIAGLILAEIEKG